MNAFRPARSLLALALTLAPIGCSHRYDDLPREPVAGTVNMDGQALPEAVIQFAPIGDATKGPTVGAVAEIKDGRFSIPREDGLVPGTYRVSISHAELKEAHAKGRNKTTAPVPKTTMTIPSRTNAIGPELIPARYNAQSELKADIPAGGHKDLKFDLRSK